VVSECELGMSRLGTSESGRRKVRNVLVNCEKEVSEKRNEYVRSGVAAAEFHAFNLHEQYQCSMCVVFLVAM
jgi:hypothetical protein